MNARPAVLSSTGLNLREESVTDPQEFAGRPALVTGAATGNGEAIARRLFAGGAPVALVGHDRPALEALAGALDGSGERAFAIEADVRDEGAMRDAVHRTVARFGGLRLAVNNAGTPGRPTRRSRLLRSRTGTR
jgi:NAD(P)-dependent dehydrogenase (short-subunit alcohol dehydrogenase family)